MQYLKLKLYDNDNRGRVNPNPSYMIVGFGSGGVIQVIENPISGSTALCTKDGNIGYVHEGIQEIYEKLNETEINERIF